jgi:probable addiction module antidote protein
MKRKATETTLWDSAEALRNNREVAAYIDSVLEDGDPALLSHALGVVARTKGMTHLAQATGLGRESLYKSLSRRGNPSFSTVLKVLNALGVEMRAVPVARRRAHSAAKGSYA